MIDGCVQRPDDEVERWRRAGYWEGLTLGGMLRAAAREHGERVALVCAERRITYQGLDAWVDRLARGFARAGLNAGDRVLVQLPNSAEFVAVCFAFFRLGVLPVFTLPSYRIAELRHLAEISQATALIIPDVFAGFDYRELAERVCKETNSVNSVFVAGETGEHVEFTALGGLADGTLPDVSPAPSDAAFFLLSGGTTALPKLIPRTHDDYLYQGRIAAEASGVDAATTYLAVLPLEFNFTWGCPGVIGVLRAGGTVVLAKSPSPDECFALIERERVTLTSVVPTIAHLWLEAAPESAYDLSSLQVLQIGSAKLHRSVAEQITPTLGCALQQVFGMAEGLLTFTRFDDPQDVVLGTQGQALSPGDEIRVADPVTGVPVPAGEVGELVTRGPYTLRGYYRAPEHNKTAFTADGFYRSGDLVRLTPRGDMIVAGRVKDVIVRGGDKISATELEAALVTHPAVRQAAVVPMPDPVLGERTCAFVIAEGTPPRLLALKRHLRDAGLAEFKLPDRIEPVTEFPLTGLGKVDKKALAGDIAARLAVQGVTS